MEKILITGATGVIGYYVLLGLIRKGIHPIAGLRDQKKLSPRLQEKSKVIALDYNDLASIEIALAAVNKVFLVPPMHTDMSNMMKNVLSKIKTIDAIVSISASGADSNSPFWLLRSHGEIREEDTFYFPQGITKKSMIDTFDIGEIAAKILTEEGHAGNTYNLAGYDYFNF